MHHSVSPGSEMPPGSAIMREARRWRGTPYRHRASLRGAGTDCLGLLRGVWRAICGPEPETPPPYTPEWSEISGREALLEAAERHLRAIPAHEACGGDVLVFQMRSGGPAKHLAILMGSLRDPSPPIIHAISGRAVAEEPLLPFMRRRLVRCFRFPEIRSSG